MKQPESTPQSLAGNETVIGTTLAICPVCLHFHITCGPTSGSMGAINYCTMVTTEGYGCQTKILPFVLGDSTKLDLYRAMLPILDDLVGRLQGTIDDLSPTEEE